MIKLLEDNIEKQLHDLGMEKDFFKTKQKALTKENIDILALKIF